MSKNQATWELVAIDKISPTLKKLQGRMDNIRQKTGGLLGKFRGAFGKMGSAVRDAASQVPVLADPDEVWHRHEQKKGGIFYIRYYEDYPIIVRVNTQRDETLEATTLFRAEPKPSTTDENTRKKQQVRIIYG